MPDFPYSQSHPVPWKQRLFDAYLSTGQAQAPAFVDDSPDPYLDRLIRDHVPQDRSLTILDLACGHGRLLRRLMAHGYTSIAGVDVSSEQVAVAHQCGMHQVVCADLFLYLGTIADCSQDVVFLMDILEHLEAGEILDLLDSVHRVLKPQGRLIAHVPNGEGLFAMRVRYGDFTHTQAFTQRSLSQLLRACHFHNIRCFEDKPPVHGAVSFMRRVLWEVMTMPFRLLLAAESGHRRSILSQNLLVTASMNRP